MPRSLRVLAPALLLAATLGMLLVGLAIGGAAAERTLVDPGAVVRYGVPITRTLVNIAMAGLIGSVVMAIWAFSSERPEMRLALDIAAGSAAVLTVASAATLIFTYVDVSGLPFSGTPASARASPSSSPRLSSASCGSSNSSSPRRRPCWRSRCVIGAWCCWCSLQRLPPHCRSHSRATPQALRDTARP
nr:hypothetical protein [Leucobacter luti]